MISQAMMNQLIRQFPIVIISGWVFIALVSSFIELNPDLVQLPKILHSPEWSSWLGYDDLGRPILDRLIMGAQTSLIVAVWVTGISLIIGTLLGATSAYFGGWVDSTISRIIDIFLAVPGILLAIAFAGVMGPGIENVVIALSLVGWVGYARLARSQVLALKHRDHVQAAVSLGVSSFTIIRRYLIPLVSAPLIVEATFGVSAVILAEAGLSFLGLGVQPPDASWGSMIRDGTAYMLIAPHMVIIPGLTLVLIVLSVNLLGDRLRDKLDHRTI